MWTLLLLSSLPLVHSFDIFLGEVCPVLPESDRLFFLNSKQCPAVKDDRCIDNSFDHPGIHIFRCRRHPLWTEEERVLIVNSTELSSFLSMRDPFGRSTCTLTLFFSPDCPFSVRLAPSYNTMAAVFPNLLVLALNASDFSKYDPSSLFLSTRVNSRFGISGTPTVILFVDGMGVARNDEKPLKRFVEMWTDQLAVADVPPTLNEPIDVHLEEMTVDRYFLGSFVVLLISISYLVACYTPCGQQLLNRWFGE